MCDPMKFALFQNAFDVFTLHDDMSDCQQSAPINAMIVSRHADMTLVAFATPRDYEDFLTLNDCRDDEIL